MKIVIHPGYPKCASSHLQSLLELKERDGGLASLGYRYPLETVEGVGQRNGHLLVNYLTHGTQSSLRELIQQLTYVDMHCLYSDESAISQIDLSKLLALAESLPEAVEITVVTAIREPSQWLLSDYYQHIKTGVHCQTLHEHVLVREDQGVMDYVKYFNRFRSASPENIRIIACDHSALVSCIESVIGSPVGFLGSGTTSNINSNISPSANIIEAMRTSSLLGSVENHENKKLLEPTITDNFLNLQRQEFMSYLECKYSKYRKSVKELEFVEFYEK